MVLSSRRPGRNSKLQQIPLLENLWQGSFLFQAEGLALFRAKGSIPIGRGGHARAFFSGIKPYWARIYGNSSKGYWANAEGIMHHAATNEMLRRAGYPCLMDYYVKVH